MTDSLEKNKLMKKLAAIKALAVESEALLREASPDVEKLLATLQAQAGIQQALLEKLLGAMQRTEKEQDLSDTLHAAGQELADAVGGRVVARVA